MNAPNPTVRHKGSRRLRRSLAMIGFVVGVIVVSAGCMPELLVPATSGRNFGQGPLDAIREAASRTAETKLVGRPEEPDPNYNCGLSSTDLAAMMIVPTYFEAGGSLPSPMTLSRWDNTSGGRASNANLFAFSRTTGPYVNAFFSPGIGLWQFDSAGRWDMTAADAINATTAANQAAATIAYRWCNAPSSKKATPQLRRMYAWGPWYGCTLGGTTKCEDTFNQLVTSDGKLNTSFDPAVTRTGGMQQRVCNLRGLGDGLTCFYINPALAEGSRGWQGGTYDGSGSSITPLPKPFYSVRANGNEYRVWLKEDTGYDIDITASKPVTANARDSLTWTASTVLCDTSTRRGFCGNVDPVGSLDVVSLSAPNQVRVTGWAIDFDSAKNPVDVHIYVGDVRAIFSASLNRPDVGVAIPSAGPLHGFDFTLAAPTGSQNVCVYAIDIGGGNNAQIGCRTVNVTGNPVGWIDVLTAAPGSVSIEGWSAVPGDAAAPAEIAVDGVTVARISRSVSRPDVAKAAPWAGATAGFSATIPVSGGSRTVCLSSGGAAAKAISCRTISLPTGSPFGSLDAVNALPGAISLAGWIIDPDVKGAIDVHVWIGGSRTVLSADQGRADLAAIFPAYGAAHGFSMTVPISRGPQSVCVYGINVGGGANILVGCRQINVPGGSPFGSLDAVVRGPNGVTVAGWVIDPDTSASIPVHVYVGSDGTAILANLQRPDVGAAFTLYGNAHGFGATLTAPQTPVRVCVYSIEAAGSGTNQLLGCRTV